MAAWLWCEPESLLSWGLMEAAEKHLRATVGMYAPREATLRPQVPLAPPPRPTPCPLPCVSERALGLEEKGLVSVSLP